MRRRSGLAGVALACTLIAGACGSSGSKGASTAATVDQGVAQGVAAALGGSSTTASGATSTSLPNSLDEWEALADSQRAAIVKKIKDNKWGKSADGKTVTGPDGFTIDLTKCPAGWSDTEGITNTEIKIGHTAPLSGTAADFGNGSRAMNAVFKYYSDKGVLTDTAGNTRKINLTIRDDAYDSARTIPLVDELIDSEKVFAMMTTGSPTTLKVYDKLNQRCIAHPLGGITGHPAWADPVNHPWTTGLQVAYSTEAVLWGGFIEQHLSEFAPGKIKVASLVTSNDYGKAYDTSFRAYIAQSPNKDRFDYFNESIEITAPTITDPMTTLAAKQPDVFILMGGATQCTQAVQEVAQNGMRQRAKYLITNQNCKGFLAKSKVGGDGSLANGWWIVGGGVRDMNSPAEDNNPYIQWARQLLTNAGLDYRSSNNFGLGFEYAFPVIQALRIAGQLDGGVTRTNLMLALRTMDMTNPMLLPGIKFSLSGNKKAYFIEGSDISQYDSAKQQWVPQGPVIDLSGKSKNCAFNQATQTCG